MKYSKMQNHISHEAKPEVCNLLAACFGELEGRSKGNPKKRGFYEKISLQIIYFTMDVCLTYFHLAVALFFKIQCVSCTSVPFTKS